MTETDWNILGTTATYAAVIVALFLGLWAIFKEARSRKKRAGLIIKKALLCLHAISQGLDDLIKNNPKSHWPVLYKLNETEYFSEMENLFSNSDCLDDKTQSEIMAFLLMFRQNLTIENEQEAKRVDKLIYDFFSYLKKRARIKSSSLPEVIKQMRKTFESK